LSIEQFGRTEEMRHIPTVEVILKRVDPILRNIGEVLLASLSSLEEEAAAPARLHIERAIHWLEAIDAALRPRQHVDASDKDLARRFKAAADHASQALTSCDRSGFRKRSPFHLFERSKGECVVAAVAAAEHELNQAADAVSTHAPDVHHKVANARHPMVPFPTIDEKYRTRAEVSKPS